MLKPENQADKQRFEALKSAEENEGASEEEATERAAEETKEVRKREGRSKSPTSPRGKADGT